MVSARVRFYFDQNFSKTSGNFLGVEGFKNIFFSDLQAYCVAAEEGRKSFGARVFKTGSKWFRSYTI